MQITIEIPDTYIERMKELGALRADQITATEQLEWDRLISYAGFAIYNVCKYRKAG